MEIANSLNAQAGCTELNSGERELIEVGFFADRKLPDRLSWNREQLTTLFSGKIAIIACKKAVLVPTAGNLWKKEIGRY